MEKEAIFSQLQEELTAKGFEFEATNFKKPWGGYFVIKTDQSEKFIRTFYPEENAENLTKGGTISPKILVVAPGARLSWQYHHRRSEVWKLIAGTAGVIRSLTDEQGAVYHLEQNEKVVLAKGERHRLVGLKEFGVIAEIWQHSDPEQLSNEEDIVRLEDDYGR